MTRLHFLIPLLMLAPILGGCSKSKTILQFDPGLQTVNPAVKAGDIIRFQTDLTHTFVPTFPLGSPCTAESDLQRGECTVAQSAPLNNYPYKCPGCADPEVVVYSGTQSTQARLSARTSHSEAGPQHVDIGCVKQAISLLPPEVKEHQSDEVTIHWEGAGSMPVNDWSVADLNVCQQTGPFNANNPDCTVDKTKVMPMMSYPYTVQGPSCSTTPGQGKITIE